MNKVSKTLLLLGKIIGAIILVLLVIYIPDWGFLKSEITEYPVFCETKVELGSCPAIAYTLNPTTYKVLGSRQEVLYWSHAGGSPQRLTKCAVRDRKNWSCKYDDESAEFGFTDGKFHNLPLGLLSDSIKEYDAQVFYVSKLQWHKANVGLMKSY